MCANADGEITQAERDWCVGYCAATGATPEMLRELQDYDGAEDIHEMIERGRHLGTAHRPVICDSIRVCCANGVLSDPERATIVRMAGEIGVGDEEISEFERIYREDRTLREKRIKAVFPSGTPYLTFACHRRAACVRRKGLAVPSGTAQMEIGEMLAGFVRPR